MACPIPTGRSSGRSGCWDAARTVREHTQIKALVYFDANAQHSYALTAGSPALQAFRTIAHVPYFNPVSLPAP